MSPVEDTSNQDVFSDLILDVGRDMLGSLEFTKDPESSVIDIIEYGSRLRVTPLEKFNNPCYIAIQNIFSSEQNKGADVALGALLMYINEEILGTFLKKMGVEGLDEDIEEDVIKTLNELIPKFSEKTIESLSAQGYSGLVLGDPHSYRNTILDGINFHYEETKMYSSSFYAWKTKAVVLDLTIGPVGA